MGWRIISISSLCKLDYKMEYLVVRSRDETTRIHMSELSVLILESTAVSLTAYLLRELERNKVEVLFCDETRAPYAMLASLYGSHDTALRYRQQIEWAQAAKESVWAEIIRRKISGQIAMLPVERRLERELLQSYVPQVLPGDSTNREGHASKVYFNALFGKHFSREADTPVNAALNYGYSLFLSAVAREIAAAGYCTQLGIHHNNRFNRLNLASDLMEPFRPYIDEAVRDFLPTEFERGERLRLIAVLNRKVLLNGHSQYMLSAVRLYVQSVFAALENAQPELISFPEYEQ